MERVTKLLVALGSPPVDVNGYTDAIGSDGDNTALSETRASAVVTSLGLLGVASGSMRPHGFGEQKPIRPETTPSVADHPAGRQANRRVELVLLD